LSACLLTVVQRLSGRPLALSKANRPAGKEKAARVGMTQAALNFQDVAP